MSGGVRGIALGVGLALGVATSQAATIEEAFNAIDQALAESFAGSLPLIAASAGVRYRFDPATGSFDREPSITGQLFLERADPIGKGRWNASLSYQWVALKSLLGQPADDLQDPVPIRGTAQVPILLLPKANVNVQANQFTASLTYGVTDDLEVNLTVPLIYSALTVSLDFARVVVLDGTPVVDAGTLSARERPVGVGDIFLRGKYRVLDADPIHGALGVVLRLPSGDESSYQGTGSFEASPMVYLSTRPFEPASWARLQGYLNAGVDFDAGDVGASQARWGVGVDWAPVPSLTAALAVLGRNQFQRIAPPGFFDFPRCTTSITNCTTELPLFGFSGARPDYYNVSLGGRVNLWRDTVIGFANVLVPLNDAGIQTKPVPLVGVEAVF